MAPLLSRLRPLIAPVTRCNNKDNDSDNDNDDDDNDNDNDNDNGNNDNDNDNNDNGNGNGNGNDTDNVSDNNGFHVSNLAFHYSVSINVIH